MSRHPRRSVISLSTLQNFLFSRVKVSFFRNPSSKKIGDKAYLNTDVNVNIFVLQFHFTLYNLCLIFHLGVNHPGKVRSFNANIRFTQRKIMHRVQSCSRNSSYPLSIFNTGIYLMHSVELKLSTLFFIQAYFYFYK